MKIPSINLLRPLRFLMAALLCAFLWIGFATPSFAATSNFTQGEDALKEIQKDSEQLLRGGPPSLEETQSKAQEGINEVQGGADKDMMKNPLNTGTTTSVEDQIKEGMDNIRGLFNSDSPS